MDTFDLIGHLFLILFLAMIPQAVFPLVANPTGLIFSGLALLIGGTASVIVAVILLLLVLLLVLAVCLWAIE